MGQPCPLLDTRRMPRPIYIIVARSGSLDEHSKLMSLFNIFERIHIQAVVEGGTAPETPAAIPVNLPPVEMRIATVWMADEGEKGQAFDTQLVMEHPDGSEQLVHEGEFVFSQKPATATLFRNIYDVTTFFKQAQSGLIEVRSRVRPKGDDGEWIQQSYPIIYDFEFTEKTPKPEAETSE